MTNELEELLHASPEFQAIIDKVRRDRAIDFSKQRAERSQKIKAIEARRAKSLPAATKRLDDARAAVERATAAVTTTRLEFAAAGHAMAELTDGSEREIRKLKADIRAMASPAYEALLTETLELHETFQRGAPLFGVRAQALTPHGLRALTLLFRTLSNEIRDLQEDGDTHDAEAAIVAFRASFEARVHDIVRAHSVAAYVASSPAQRERYDQEHAR